MGVIYSPEKWGEQNCNTKKEASHDSRQSSAGACFDACTGLGRDEHRRSAVIAAEDCKQPAQEIQLPATRHDSVPISQACQVTESLNQPCNEITMSWLKYFI